MMDVQALLSDAIALRAERQVSFQLSGQTFACRPPTRKEAMEWLGLLGRCYEGDVLALLEVVQRFPDLVGLPETAFEHLTPMEVVAAATRFFCRLRPGVLDAPGPAPAEPPTTSS